MSPNDYEELDYIFHPKSVAVVGASDNPVKWGYRFLRAFLDMGFQPIYPINPGKSEILGLKAYSRIVDVPGQVDYVVICVPAEFVPNIMEDCVEKGVKVVIIFTAGFSESGEEGRKKEEELLKIAKKGNIRVIGPNCFGIYCPSSKLAITPGMSKEQGCVTFVSQSGGFSITLSNIGRFSGINFSKVISYGNASDLDSTDFLEYLGKDPDTKIIALYIEGVKDGKRFLRALKRISNKKPVIVWKSGQTEEGARAVASHTGSLAGSNIIWNSIFKQTAAIRVDDFDEMIDTIITFLYMPPPKGRSVAIVSTSGGVTVAATEACAKNNLKVPLLTPATREQLKKILPSVGVSIENPIDLLGVADNVKLFRRVLEIVASDPEVDSLIIERILYGVEPIEELVNYWEDIRKNIKVPLAITLRSTYQYTPEAHQILAFTAYLRAKLPAYLSLPRAARAISNLVQYREKMETVIV